MPPSGPGPAPGQGGWPGAPQQPPPTGQYPPGGGGGGWGEPPAPPPGWGATPPPGGRKGGNKGLLIGLGVFVVLVLAVGAVVLLSGGDDDDDNGGGPAASTSTTAGGSTTEGTAAGGQAITSVEQAQSATVQIVAQGSFVDPELGEQTNAAGAGSGFIIDPSGIAVTNNHVVTGAASLQVFVGGETEPRNAQILGTSECSDLAVIDIDGDGYPYMEWYEGEVSTGLDVFAAGFPLGDPEFTLTSGIISKADAAGESDWASVDAVLEHDATINPGNSGGPLVDESGRVVGVNYASFAEARQSFAIAGAEAQPLVEQMQAGEHVEYLGINGQAVIDEEGGLSGVWVAAVESGSPAANAGIQGGDIVTKLEGLALATDGSMADYCDILRTQGSDAPLAVQVLRFATEEILQGTLNEDEPLEVAQSLGSELEESGPEVEDSTSSYAEYTYVSDDTGALSVEVPAEWSDVDGTPITLADGRTAAQVTATGDLDAYRLSFEVSGVQVVSFEGFSDPDATIDFLTSGVGVDTACQGGERQDYDDGLYVGRYEHFTCGSAVFVAIAASPEGQEFTVYVNVQVLNDADYEALDRVIQSFIVSTD